MPEPSAPTPEQQRQICEALRGGANRRGAAILAGVFRMATFKRWMCEFPDFRRAVQDAEDAYIAELLGRIRKAAQTNRKAARWLARYEKRKKP